MLALLSAGLAATPLRGEPLAEETEHLIACTLVCPPSVREVPVFEQQRECEECKGTYHYRLWLPKGYHSAPHRRWPCLFVASGGGNPKMGPMARWLKANGYIVVMLVESRNGPWAPIIGNFLAAHDDVVRRFRVGEGMKFATGMSGGARAASMFVQIRSGFCGLILQGAGYAMDNQGRYYTERLRQQPSLFVAMTIGRNDFNHTEVDRVKTLLPPNRFLLLEFDGGHQWAPSDVFEQAIGWIEQRVYHDPPTYPMLRPIYLARFAVLADRFQAAATPAERLQAAEAALTYARQRNIAADPSVATSFAALHAELAKLRAESSR